MGRYVFANCAAMFALALFARGASYYVSPEGSDANAGDAENPFLTIEHAISAAADGDEILLSEGTHTLSSMGEYVIVDKAISIRGAASADRVIVKPDTRTAFHAFFSIDSDGASLKNLTITGANIKDDSSGALRRSPLLMSAGIIDGVVVKGNLQPSTGTLKMSGGLVQNSIFENNRSTSDVSHWLGSGGALYMEGGKVQSCIFRGNYTRCFGGALYIYGGEADSCVITNNSVERNIGSGAVVAGGVLSRSLVADNRITGAQSYGGAVCILRGRVERTEIRQNRTGGACAGLSLYKDYPNGTKNAAVQDCLAVNCLVWDNYAVSGSAGAFISGGGILSHSLVAGNGSNSGTSAFELRQGRVENTIIYGNVGLEQIKNSGGELASNIFDFEYGGDTAQDPLFLDPGAGDWRLRIGSPAIDAACETQSTLVDFLGAARPVGAKSDIGPYEYVPRSGDMHASFAVSRTIFTEAGDVILTGYADGEGISDSLLFEWDTDGDGEADLAGREATLTISEPKTVTITLKVTDSASGKSASFTRENIIAFVAKRAYVSPNGNNTPPYDTPAKAANSLQTAIDAVQCSDEEPGEVIVLDGTYQCNGIWTVVQRPVEVKSQNGPGKTILKAWNQGTTASNKRVMLVDHPKAFVAGFAMEGGKWDSSAQGDEGAGALRVISGTVSNCVIRSNNGNDYGGGLNIRGGVVTHCEIYGNTAYRGNNGSAAKGGGVYMTGGVLSYSVISNNVASSINSGSGIKMTAGTVHHCLVADNLGYGNGATGIGIDMSGGTVSNCIIRANGVRIPSRAKSGAGAIMSGGTMIGNLIVGNVSSDNAAAVSIAGGQFLFNTVTANRSVSNSGSGVLLSGASAQVRDNIIYGNGVESDSLRNIDYRTAKLFTGNIVSPATYGADNIDSDPLFKDPAGGDYSLSVGSPAIDAATDSSLAGRDLFGNMRPKDGLGDGTARSDIGAIEAQGAGEGALRCSFSLDKSVSHGSILVTATAFAGGEGSEGDVAYIWSTPGGEIAESFDGGRMVKIRYADFGKFSVSLEARSAAGESARFTMKDIVAVGAGMMYLAHGGSGLWPYATPQTATNDILEIIQSAVYIDGKINEIVALDGEYEIKAKWATIGKPIRLYSQNGAEKTILKGANPENARARKVLNVVHGEALVNGFTLTGGMWDNHLYGDSGAVVKISGGIVSNCIVRNNIGGDVGGAVELSGGKLIDSFIHSNESFRDSNAGNIGQGGGVYVYGPALVSGCTISNNCAGVYAGGVYLDHKDGVVSNSVICNNFAGRTAYYNRTFSGSKYKYAGCYVKAGTIQNCIIRDNYSYHDVGGVGLDSASGRLCGSVLSGNAGRGGALQALYVNGGQVLNCTIAANGTNSWSSAYRPATAVQMPSGSIVNTIIWGNDACEEALLRTGGTVLRLCSEEAIEEGGTAANPKFAGAERGDFSLKALSPLRDMGDMSYYPSWQGLLDLAGNPRIDGRSVDIGAYEIARPRPLVYLLR